MSLRKVKKGISVHGLTSSLHKNILNYGLLFSFDHFVAFFCSDLVLVRKVFHFLSDLFVFNTARCSNSISILSIPLG